MTRFEGEQKTHWIRLKAASTISGIPWDTVRWAVRQGKIRGRRARARRNKKQIIIWVDADSLADFQKRWRPKAGKRSPGRPKGSTKAKYRRRAPKRLKSSRTNGTPQ